MAPLYFHIHLPEYLLVVFCYVDADLFLKQLFESCIKAHPHIIFTSRSFYVSEGVNTTLICIHSLICSKGISHPSFPLELSFG